MKTGCEGWSKVACSSFVEQSCQVLNLEVWGWKKWKHLPMVGRGATARDLAWRGQQVSEQQNQCLQCLSKEEWGRGGSDHTADFGVWVRCVREHGALCRREMKREEMRTGEFGEPGGNTPVASSPRARLLYCTESSKDNQKIKKYVNNNNNNN